MIKIKKILMSTDFSQNANQALRYAAVFADKFDSKLTLFNVIALFQDDPNNPRHHFPNLKALYTIMDQNAIANMDQFDLHFDKLQVNKVAVRGISPAEEIINYAESNEADLIVMGTHGRSALGHFLIGSVAEKVVRHAKCPVLTISHQEKEMYERPAIKSILVPIDFSNHSKQALKYATSLAVLFGASLEILHVIDQRIHPAYYVMGEQSIFSIYPNLLEKSMTFLKEFVKDGNPQNVNTEFFVREGNPHSEIVNFAKNQGADLIAMATHGLSGLEKLLIGSTTEKVVRKSDVPVLTVT